MANPRPGTVDYSHFAKITDSDDSEDEKLARSEQAREDWDAARHRQTLRAEYAQYRGQNSEAGSEAPEEVEDEGESEDESNPCLSADGTNSDRKRKRTSDDDDFDNEDDEEEEAEEEDEERDGEEDAEADLQKLQAAWARAPATNNAAAKTLKSCSYCKTPGATQRCSKCKLVFFCDRQCQTLYHPVHKHECLDTSAHMTWWGIMNSDAASSRESHQQLTKEAKAEATKERWRIQAKALQQRRMRKREKALKLAAARFAAERSRRQRQTAQVNKGGGGKDGGKNDADGREETCSICQCEFTVGGDAGYGLHCPGSHFMCHECSGVYVNSVVADLEVSYPPKCSLCKAAILVEQFERQLSTRQLAIVRAYAAEQALQPGESIFRCSECGWYEIRTDDPVIWRCASPACGHAICTVCLLSVPSSSSLACGSNGLGSNQVLDRHMITCARLRGPKKVFEQALAAGSQGHCPVCDLAGRKDDACTHMHCPRCATEWCYVCGLAVDDCDKAPPPAGAQPRSDIFLHNRDWEVNPQRCPMFLTQILEVDLNWLGDSWQETATDESFDDDFRCLEYFHRFQTIKQLQRARAEIGEEDFALLYAHFSSVANCGFPLEEVLNTDTSQLIERGLVASYEDAGDEHDVAIEDGGGEDGGEDGA